MQKQNSNMRNWNNSLKDPGFFFFFFNVFHISDHSGTTFLQRNNYLVLSSIGE